MTNKNTLITSSAEAQVVEAQVVEAQPAEAQVVKKKYVYPKETIQAYNKKYIDSQKDLKIECPDCMTSYARFSYWAHLHSKSHLNVVRIKNILASENTKEKQVNDNNNIII